MKGTKKVRRIGGLVSPATAGAAVHVYPGVRQDHTGARYRTGLDANGRQVKVPYVPTLPEPSGYPFDLRPVGGHLWQAAGQPVRCIKGCSVCVAAKPRVIRERLAA